MIYFLYGNDTAKKAAQIKTLGEGLSIVRVPSREITRNAIISLASQAPLFGDAPVTVIENAFSDPDSIFDAELLDLIKESSNMFIFLEDSCTALELKKYKKYLADAILCDRKEPTRIKTNPFAIADAFGNRDKIGAWTLYVSLIEAGEAPEAISGMLFWKIKTLLLARTSGKFTKTELEHASSKLVDIYHKAHGGMVDMNISLEQFILSTL